VSDEYKKEATGTVDIGYKSTTDFGKSFSSEDVNNNVNEINKLIKEHTKSA